MMAGGEESEDEADAERPTMQDYSDDEEWMLYAKNCLYGGTLFVQTV
jgi:hypothetical protein